MIRILALCLALAITTAHIAAPAMAHTKVQKSEPANGAVVGAGLSEIKLAFAKKIRLTLVKLTRDGDETPIEATSEMPKGFAKKATLAVAPLTAGEYKLNWTGVATDGHVVKDEIAFTVKDGN